MVQAKAWIQEMIRHGKIRAEEFLVIQPVAVECILQRGHELCVRTQVLQQVNVERGDIFCATVFIVMVVRGHPGGNFLRPLEPTPVERPVHTEFPANHHFAVVVLQRDAGQPAPLPVRHLRADQCTRKIERVRIAGDRKPVRLRDPEV